MELTRKVDRILAVLVVLTVVALVGFVFTTFSKKVFAGDGEKADSYLVDDKKFVVFYSDNDKLVVKTDAKTVGEAISRAGYVLNVGDMVEPNLETEIDSDNFSISIYRARPVIVKDGVVARYLMTSSYDEKKIVEEAGIVLSDGDEISLTKNEDFLETGAVNVYSITRKEVAPIETEVSLADEAVEEPELEIEDNLMIVQVPEIEVGFERMPLTARMGRNRYAVKKDDGTVVERQETYYDLNMSRVMQLRLNDGCGDGTYSVREDGVKVDFEGYVLVAANLDNYPFCSVVETSLGVGKVYDTGLFAEENSEQFDIATDWTRQNGI